MEAKLDRLLYNTRMYGIVTVKPILLYNKCVNKFRNITIKFSPPRFSQIVFSLLVSKLCCYQRILPQLRISAG